MPHISAEIRTENLPNLTTVTWRICYRSWKSSPLFFITQRKSQISQQTKLATWSLNSCVAGHTFDREQLLSGDGQRASIEYAIWEFLFKWKEIILFGFQYFISFVCSFIMCPTSPFLFSFILLLPHFPSYQTSFIPIVSYLPTYVVCRSIAIMRYQSLRLVGFTRFQSPWTRKRMLNCRPYVCIHAPR
jgi:hypothetical protein